MQVCGSTRLYSTNCGPQSFPSSRLRHQHCVLPHIRQQRNSTVVSAAAAASGPFFNRTQTNSIRYGPSKAPTSDPLHTHDSQAAVGPALVNRGLSADPVQAVVALLRPKAHAVDLLIAQNVDRSQMLSAGLLALQFAQLLTVGGLACRFLTYLVACSLVSEYIHPCHRRERLDSPARSLGSSRSFLSVMCLWVPPLMYRLLLIFVRSSQTFLHRSVPIPPLVTVHMAEFSVHLCLSICADEC